MSKKNRAVEEAAQLEKYRKLRSKWIESQGFREAVIQRKREAREDRLAVQSRSQNYQMGLNDPGLRGDARQKLEIDLAESIVRVQELKREDSYLDDLLVETANVKRQRGELLQTLAKWLQDRRIAYFGGGRDILFLYSERDEVLNNLDAYRDRSLDPGVESESEDLNYMFPGANQPLAR